MNAGAHQDFFVKFLFISFFEISTIAICGLSKIKKIKIVNTQWFIKVGKIKEITHEMPEKSGLIWVISWIHHSDCFIHF